MLEVIHSASSTERVHVIWGHGQMHALWQALDSLLDGSDYLGHSTLNMECTSPSVPLRALAMRGISLHFALGLSGRSDLQRQLGQCQTLALRGNGI